MIYDLSTAILVSGRIRRVKVTCRCGHSWTEEIPAEVHDSWLRIALQCTACSAIFVLQNKQLSRLSDAQAAEINFKTPRSGWTQPKGNA